MFSSENMTVKQVNAVFHHPYVGQCDIYMFVSIFFLKISVKVKYWKDSSRRERGQSWNMWLKIRTPGEDTNSAPLSLVPER